ncbi:MAG: hypothetical protein WCH65_02780 [bacterium]
MGDDYIRFAGDDGSDMHEQMEIEKILKDFTSSLLTREEDFFVEIQKKRQESNEPIEKIIQDTIKNDPRQSLQQTASYQKYKTFPLTLDVAIDEYVVYLKNAFIKRVGDERKEELVVDLNTESPDKEVIPTEDVFEKASDEDIEQYRIEINQIINDLIEQYFQSLDSVNNNKITEEKRKECKNNAWSTFLQNNKESLKNIDTQDIYIRIFQ